MRCVTPRQLAADRGAREAGFTLIELIIVVTIIGILAAIAMPAMQNAPIRAREAVVKEDLYQMRSSIDQYLADRGTYPESLDALVEAGYLRFIPVDPFASTDSPWEELDAAPSDLEGLEPIEDDLAPESGGILDVRYNSDRVALDGSLMREW